MSYYSKPSNPLATGLFAGLLVLVTACEQNPQQALDTILVDVGGYLAYKNPVKNVDTGTIVGGRPSALSYYAPGEECFPQSKVRRHVNREYLNRKYVNAFKGNLGFLTTVASPVSGGGSLTKEHTVVIEIDGITVEYLNAPDITRYYRNGMDDVCKDYLDELGFIMQAAITDKLSIAIYDRTNVAIQLDETNINEYLTISGDAQWEIVNNYRVDIKTPHHLGYHLGQLRKSDGQMVMKRAKTAVDDRFVFEDDGVFDSPSDTNRTESFFFRKNPSLIDQFIPLAN